MAEPDVYRETCFSEHGSECVVCGSGGDVIAHHVNGDRADNSPENLRPMCTSCHAEVHHGNIPEWSKKVT